MSRSCCRMLSSLPARLGVPSTRAQRRSPTRPASPTSEESRRSPAIDFTGYRQTSATDAIGPKPTARLKSFWQLRLEREADRVLTDGDKVAVGQLRFDHRLAIDQRAVGASKVADPEEAAPDLDPAVMTGGGRVADHDVVVRCAADGDHLARQRHYTSRKRPCLGGQQRSV